MFLLSAGLYYYSLVSRLIILTSVLGCVPAFTPEAPQLPGFKQKDVEEHIMKAALGEEMRQAMSGPGKGKVTGAYPVSFWQQEHSDLGVLVGRSVVIAVIVRVTDTAKDWCGIYRWRIFQRFATGETWGKVYDKKKQSRVEYIKKCSTHKLPEGSLHPKFHL